MRKNSSTLGHQLHSQLCRQSQSSCQIHLQSLQQILTILLKIPRSAWSDPEAEAGHGLNL